MKRRWIILAGITLLAPVARAAELRTFQVPTALSLGWGGESTQLMQFQFDATPRLEFDLSADSSMVLSARLRLDAQENLEPGSPARDSYAPPSRPATIGSAGTLELRDVYWENRGDSAIVRLGKQQIVWGRLDGVKVLDVLNPQSFREFILDDFDQSRISLWSAYTDIFWKGWRIEGAVIPDFSAHEIPKRGAWFELTAPRFRYGAVPGSTIPPIDTENARSPWSDTAIALRLSRSVGNFDLSALAYEGNDHEPLGRLESAGGSLRLEQFYRKRQLYGLSLETSLGPFALRAETAFQPSRVFNTRSGTALETARADQVTAGIAADMNAFLGIFVNVQLLWDEVLDAPQSLVRPDRDRLATVFLRRNFAYDTLRMEARWYHSFDDRDDLYRLSVTYDLGNDTTLSASADWFDGTPLGLFGQFAPRDRVVFSLERTF